MAVDEALLHNFRRDDLPILRLYSWEDSLTLGRFSNISKSLDLEMVEKKNIPYVRRMTGGGILIHGGDVSYSLILDRDSLDHLGVKESYRYFCKFLIDLYKKLGIEADFAYNLRVESPKSNICMASNEPYDIIIEGQKIGGNAQRYTREALFQHGTIPISLDEVLFGDIFLEESGLREATALDRIGEGIMVGELTLLVVDAFSQSFGVNIINDTLDPSEQQSADKLLREKYSQDRWNIDAQQDRA
ncbi:MAG: lipoate--protein ligase family protein [Campylobacterota bacterium]|nr:lipoate--protein ligase family protein [Campylobacterota bacterium]